MIEIPGYTILRPLGQGGMATVYLAVQQSLGREVALKILSPALAQDPIATERFLREARIAAKLHHPQIVAIHDVGVHDGTPYMSIAYEPGGTVAQLARGHMDPKAVFRIIRDIAGALDYAHRQGVCHRDVKPENILQRTDGSCVLSDFGIAHAAESQIGLTREGTSVGTPHYMSPEQLRGERGDGRSDLYSLGIVFYQLLIGEFPYHGTDGWAIGMQHLNAAIPRLPPSFAYLQELLDALLAKEPSGRLQNGAEVVRWIDAHITLTPAMTVAMATPRGLPSSGQTSVAASIAVLPFADMSQAKDQEYFADGLSEEVLNLLAKIPNLHVAGRTSSFSFKHKNATLAEIGRELKVATVLEGSVRKLGERIRVSVQLLKVIDGFHLWSETYDRQLIDVFAVQDEIAVSVVASLKDKLLPQEVVAKPSIPESALIPEPVPEPIPEPIPEPVPEPIPEPIPELAPEPLVIAFKPSRASEEAPAARASVPPSASLTTKRPAVSPPSEPGQVPVRVSDFLSAYEVQAKTPTKPSRKSGGNRGLIISLITLLIAGAVGFAVWQFSGEKPQDIAQRCTALLSGAQAALTVRDFDRAAAGAHEAETQCFNDQLVQLQAIKVLIENGQAKVKVCEKSEAEATDLLARGLPMQAGAALESVRIDCGSRATFVQLSQQPAKATAEASSRINQARQLLQTNALDEADGLIASALTLDAQVADAEALRRESQKRRAKLASTTIAESATAAVAAEKPDIGKAVSTPQTMLPRPELRKTIAKPDTVRPSVITPPVNPLPEPARPEQVELARAGPQQLVSIRTPEPDYPTEALRAQITGQVVASFTINTDGSLSNIRIISASPRGVFERSVQSALRSWKYRPLDEPRTITRTFRFSP